MLSARLGPVSIYVCMGTRKPESNNGMQSIPIWQWQLQKLQWRIESSSSQLRGVKSRDIAIMKGAGASECAWAWLEKLHTLVIKFNRGAAALTRGPFLHVEISIAALLHLDASSSSDNLWQRWGRIYAERVSSDALYVPHVLQMSHIEYGLMDCETVTYWLTKLTHALSKWA